MRSNMTLKLCPILTVLLSVMSCGKQATDGQKVTNSPNIQNQDPSSNLVVELNSHLSQNSVYTVKNPGVFTLPDRLKIKSGSLAGRRISLTFKVSDFDSIKCNYMTSAFQPAEMDVETCYDSENNDLGNATIQPLPMQANSVIVMKLEGSSTPSNVFAYFTVDWK